MKVRGKRECQACAERWSYFDTGSVSCPACGSLRSVGVDEKALHTDSPTPIDLTAHRARFGDAAGTLPRDGVSDLEATLREYVHKRGFVRGGELLPLDETYLAALELLEAVDVYDRRIDPTDADRAYVLDLLSGADSGDRPEAADVPNSMRAARGMAAVRAADAYREDLRAYLSDVGTDEPGEETSEDTTASSDGDVAPSDRIAATRTVLGRLRDRTKRVDALQGDVDPSVSDALVTVLNEIGEFVRTGDESSLVAARAGVIEAEGTTSDGKESVGNGGFRDGVDNRRR